LSSNKNIRLAVATLLLNISSCLKHRSESTPGELAILARVVSFCKTIIESNSYESESIFRVLVALGTCILSNKEVTKNIDIEPTLRIAYGTYSGQVRSACEEVLLLLS
jgi:hypothetical protein